jgi:hypothetical protein
MVTRRAVTVLFLVQLIALAVPAQESAELRGSGGQIVVTPKGAAPFSGSLELSLSSGSDVFGRGNSPAYGVTAGGTLLQDRLWFFGSASRQESSPSRFRELQLPENATTTALGARLNGQLGGAHDFSASSFTGTGTAPSSFLSLRYNGLLSSNTLFGASITRSSGTRNSVGLVPAN